MNSNSVHSSDLNSLVQIMVYITVLDKLCPLTSRILIGYLWVPLQPPVVVFTLKFSPQQAALIRQLGH